MSPKIARKTNRNLNFLKKFPTKVFNLAHTPPWRGDHRPRPSFSVSLQSLLNLLNLGIVDDIFRLDLEKKPSFLVEKLGYPRVASLPTVLPFMSKGDLGGYMRPFIDQLPFGLGDGDLESDIENKRRGACIR